MSTIRVLFVEDDPTLNKVLSKELGEVGFEVHAFSSADGVVEAARSVHPQVALLDLRLPGQSGLDLLRELRLLSGDIQIVMLTGHGGIPEAVEAMRLGAADFLTKPTRLDVLEKTLRNAAEKADLLLENKMLRRAASSSSDPNEILGRSDSIQETRRLIGRIAPTDEAVLIEGENGTGKELIARNLHRLSDRHDQPLVILNCAAIAENLVESELFGHEKGAFTGAANKKVGLFEAAHGGTLFLDEVGELPPTIQPSLLRVLQFGEVRPVGGSSTRTVDVRLVAATNRNLEEAIEAGEFRQDLYYRLATFQIKVAPLRSRPEDIQVLAEAFLERASIKTGRSLSFDDGAMVRLLRHSWPGNARELENAITRLSVLSPSELITAAEVERSAFGGVSQSRAELPSLRLDELERTATEAALARHDGNRTKAADELGVSVRTLYNKMKSFGLDDG